MSLTVHVRAFVPGGETIDSWLGHYDMIVEGVHTIWGTALTNPVFSYRATSILQIFEESVSSDFYLTGSASKNYSDSSIYKWTFNFSDDKFSAFINALLDTVKSYAVLDASGKAFGCTLKDDNPFHVYDYTQYNCFHAVAVWMNSLGSSLPLFIYNDAHNNAYWDYSPSNMIAKYSGLSSWSLYTP